MFNSPLLCRGCHCIAKFEEVGIPRADVWKLANPNAARILGINDSGSIQAGKLRGLWLQQTAVIHGQTIFGWARPARWTICSFSLRIATGRQILNRKDCLPASRSATSDVNLARSPIETASSYFISYT